MIRPSIFIKLNVKEIYSLVQVGSKIYSKNMDNLCGIYLQYC